MQIVASLRLLDVSGKLAKSTDLARPAQNRCTHHTIKATDIQDTINPQQSVASILR
jgi:hypothetical protein